MCFCQIWFQTSPEVASNIRRKKTYFVGNHFRNNLLFWEVGIFFYWTGLSNSCQSRHVHAHMLGVIVLIGTLSSNQKDVSPFPILKKKCSVEFQTIKAVFGTCPCANSQDHLDQFTVSFSSRQKFTFLFSRKLFEFGACVNSVDHLDCSYGGLTVFHKKICISGSKFLSHQWRQLLELALVLFLLTIWISDCCLAHVATRNQDEFTLSFISRRKFIFLFFEEAVRIWSLCEFS